MSEKRGSKLHRLADRYVGLLILAFLSVLLRLKRLVSSSNQDDTEPYLLVCFGAIGDLIVLTEAVQHQLSGKRVFLACSRLNLSAARLYENFYAGIEPVDLKDFFSVHRIVKKFGIRKVFDSTQWANIGPIQVGFAELFGHNLNSVGFVTQSKVRNEIYGFVVPHSNQIHELGNFVNLMAQSNKVSSNDQLISVLPSLYLNTSRCMTGKVLLHMWPSGNRSYLKAWPEVYWEELVRDLVKRGYEIYLSGAPADQPKTEALVHRLGCNNVRSLAGIMGLAELRQFITENIEFAVCVNTGILHLVASCGIPLIGLHGGVNPERWGPLGSKAISLLPESGRCAYLNYGFEYPDNDAEAYVLDRLTVAQVIAAVETLQSDR